MAVSTSTHSAGAVQAPPSLVALLITLTGDYPDLDGDTLAEAVEHAEASAAALNPGLQIGPQHVEVLVRDRLDAATARVARARGRDADQIALRASRVAPISCGPNPVACLYCREPIPAGSFLYRSLGQRLVWARCPSCGQLVTLRATTLRRLTTRGWTAPAGSPQG